VIASIGSFLTSLLPPTTSSTSSHSLDILLSPLSILSTTSTSDEEALNLRNKHVFILSLTGTIARLLTGISADYLAPPLVAVPAPHSDDPHAPTHLYIRKRKQRLSRSLFAALCAVLLAGIFGWSAGYLQSEKGLWVLSAGTGGFYGALFTLSVSRHPLHYEDTTDIMQPAIVSSHFGPSNFGLAWGMVSYFVSWPSLCTVQADSQAALGSVVFSYIYAYLSEAIATKASTPAQCYGSECFNGTLGIAAVCCVISGLGFAWIGRRWKV